MISATLYTVLAWFSALATDYGVSDLIDFIWAMFPAIIAVAIISMILVMFKGMGR